MSYGTAEASYRQHPQNARLRLQVPRHLHDHLDARSKHGDEIENGLIADEHVDGLSGGRLSVGGQVADQHRQVGDEADNTDGEHESLDGQFASQ